ncbi:MAG: hypothetical protein WCK37_01605 [Candidatus Falkowbacteria bacterium]
MEKVKNDFGISDNIVEITQWHKIEAERFAQKLQNAHQVEGLLSLDCAPTDNRLNLFHYNNGLEDTRIVKSLAGNFLGHHLAWMDEKIALNNETAFKTDFVIGEGLKLWRRVSPNNYEEEIDWSQAFCVKQENGASRIWHPEWRKFRHDGNLSTMTAIKVFIFNDTSYLQKFFIPPSRNKQSVIYRLIFTCQKNQSPEMIGGLWISREGFKVYPDKKATVGLISPLATTAEIF